MTRFRSVVNQNQTGGIASGAPTKRRSLDCWCSCRKCSDQFTVTFWVRPSADPEVLSVRLERCTDAHVADGELIHRCGGILRVFDLPGRCRLDGEIPV